MRANGEASSDPSQTVRRMGGPQAEDLRKLLRLLDFMFTMTGGQTVELNGMIHCGRPARFVIWRDGKRTASDSGAPCGTACWSRGRLHGWEVCEECVGHPYLVMALSLEFKP